MMLDFQHSCASGASMALRVFLCSLFHAHTNSVFCLVSGESMTCPESVLFQISFRISI